MLTSIRGLTYLLTIQYNVNYVIGYILIYYQRFPKERYVTNEIAKLMKNCATCTDNYLFYSIFSLYLFTCQFEKYILL